MSELQVFKEIAASFEPAAWKQLIAGRFEFLC